MTCHGGATCNPKGPACTLPAVSDGESAAGGGWRNGSQGEGDTGQFPGRRIEAQLCQQAVIMQGLAWIASWVVCHGLHRKTRPD